MNSNSEAALYSVLVVPLGGWGEIGMNCFALVDDGKILIVDCGAAFPDDDLGVEILHPDFTWLKANEEDIVGIWITHGHEDHIGGLPYLFRGLSIEVPVFAPAHSCELITMRFEAQGTPLPLLRKIEVGCPQQVGPFNVEAIAVAHSIIDATALCIETSCGRIIHTGDFNLDAEQPAGHLTDETRFQQLGQSGIRLLLSDSTNIDSADRPHSEGDVGRTLSELVERTQGRIVVGMFSSNIHRMLALGEAAQKTGRKLCFLGRSLGRHFSIARQMKRLNFPSDLLIAPEKLQELPPDQVLVVAGGCQGEGTSALSRLSRNNHPQLKLDRGDSVVFSSRIIPGNEKKVFALCNALIQRGINIISVSNLASIHTSGHASHSELAQMMRWVNPEAFVPVHGTLHHLREHEKLAHTVGYERGYPIETVVVENGTPIEVLPNGPLRLRDRVPHGVVRVVQGGLELSPLMRRERGNLARAGIVFLSVTLDPRGDVTSSPTVTSRGVPGMDESDFIHQMIQAEAVRALVEKKGEEMLPPQEMLRRLVRAKLYRLCGMKPVVEVHISRTTQAISPDAV